MKVNFKLHIRPLRNIYCICRLLSDRCGIEISFKLPAVTIPASGIDEECKRKALELLYPDILDLKHLVHFVNIRQIAIVVRSKNHKVIDIKFVNEAFNILQGLIKNEDIKEMFPPENIAELDGIYEKFIANGISDGPDNTGCDPFFYEYLYKYMVAIEQLAKEIALKAESGLAMQPDIAENIILQAA
ncbi:MAG: hypothetical protein JW946_04165 [Candidatus Omnitrophica bacterium]|nr:hypothetical protein [Candidatus Omnitrophota bacterium]